MLMGLLSLLMEGRFRWGLRRGFVVRSGIWIVEDTLQIKQAPKDHNASVDNAPEVHYLYKTPNVYATPIIPPPDFIPAPSSSLRTRQEPTDNRIPLSPIRILGRAVLQPAIRAIRRKRTDHVRREVDHHTQISSRVVVIHGASLHAVVEGVRDDPDDVEAAVVCPTDGCEVPGLACGLDGLLSVGVQVRAVQG